MRLWKVLRREIREASLRHCRQRWPVEPLGSGGHPPEHLGRGWRGRKQQRLLIPPVPQGRYPANGHRFNLMARVEARAAQSEAPVRELRESIAPRKTGVAESGRPARSLHTRLRPRDAKSFSGNCSVPDDLFHDEVRWHASGWSAAWLRAKPASIAPAMTRQRSKRRGKHTPWRDHADQPSTVTSFQNAMRSLISAASGLGSA